MKKCYFFALGLLLAFGCHKDSIVIQPQTVTIPVDAALPQLSGLKINGADCALDTTTNTYYFPVSLGKTLNNYTVSFGGTSTKTIMFDSLKIVNNGSANLPLVTNKQIKVQAVDQYNRTTSYNLLITGLPIVILDAGQSIGDAAVNASLALIDPDYVAQDSRLETISNTSITIRGATSRVYSKNSYLVHLVDSNQNNVNTSLLGLRSDNSWILDAEYIDQARMRNRLCTDIWNSFNNVPYLASQPSALNGTRGYMAEVFLNKKYWGLYCLTEKLDRKQLQLDKTYGNMYKAIGWGNETQFFGVSPFDNTSETWDNIWQLEYPDIGDTPAPNWQYLYNVVNFVASANDSDFANQISTEVDINNMVDYFIMINIFEALDNQAKNAYFSSADYRSNPDFFYSVWDLDGTIGRNYDGSYTTNNIIGFGNNNLFQRLLSVNPNNFKSLLKARWNALKANQLSKTTFSTRVEAYRQLMVNSNAFSREMAKWQNITQDLNTETTYMNTWYSAQYDLFDSYINSL